MASIGQSAAEGHRSPVRRRGHARTTARYLCVCPEPLRDGAEYPAIRVLQAAVARRERILQAEATCAATPGSLS